MGRRAGSGGHDTVKRVGAADALMMSSPGRPWPLCRVAPRPDARYIPHTKRASAAAKRRPALRKQSGRDSSARRRVPARQRRAARRENIQKYCGRNWRSESCLSSGVHERNFAPRSPLTVGPDWPATPSWLAPRRSPLQQVSAVGSRRSSPVYQVVPMLTPPNQRASRGGPRGQRALHSAADAFPVARRSARGRQLSAVERHRPAVCGGPAYTPLSDRQTEPSRPTNGPVSDDKRAVSDERHRANTRARVERHGPSSTQERMRNIERGSGEHSDDLSETPKTDGKSGEMKKGRISMPVPNKPKGVPFTSSLKRLLDVSYFVKLVLQTAI